MLCPAATLLITLALFGDIVLLQNGNEIQGEILQEGEDGILLKFPGGVLKLANKQVKEVRRQSRIQYLLDEAEKELRRGSSEEAIETFREAQREEPGSDRAREGLREARERHASWLSEAGRYEEAKAQFQAILALEPGDAKAQAEIRLLEETLKEAGKEEEKGRAELARGELEKGIWRLQRILDRFPDRREAIREALAAGLVEEGDRFLSAQSWPQAEERYFKALSLDPEILPRLKCQLTFAKTRQIEPALHAGDFDAVENMCTQGLQVDPVNEVLRYYHGIALEAKGKTREAAEEYLSVLNGRRPASLEGAVVALRQEAEAKLLKKESAAPTLHPRAREVLPGDFRELKTEHFVIRHKNAEIAKEVALAAEKSYSQTFQALKCATQIRTPLSILVYPTKEEYIAASGLQSWSGGAHQVARKMGILSEHRIFSFQDQPRLMTGVLPHEIAHALLTHRLNYPESIPLWANEGFAVLCEPDYVHRYYRRILSQELARRMLIPFKDIFSSTEYPKERVDLFYAECFSAVEFLVSEEGLEDFVNFLKAISRPGSSFESSLQRYFKMTGRLALEHRWQAWFESSWR